MAAVSQDGVLSALGDIRQDDKSTPQARGGIQFFSYVRIVVGQLDDGGGSGGLFIQGRARNSKPSLRLVTPLFRQVGIEQDQALHASTRRKFHAGEQPEIKIRIDLPLIGYGLLDVGHHNHFMVVS